MQVSIATDIGTEICIHIYILLNLASYIFLHPCLDVDFCMDLIPVFIYMITLNERISIQVTYMFVHKLSGFISFIIFFFLSTTSSISSVLPVTFNQTLSSTEG